jgi:hypothetical protein
MASATFSLSFFRLWNFKQVNAVVIADLEVHGSLAQFSPDLDDGLLGFLQAIIAANDRYPLAFVTIQSRILWVKPLPFGHALIRTAAELERQLIDDTGHLLRRYFRAVVEPQRNERREFHRYPIIAKPPFLRINRRK